jgi:hypothetical protein
MNNTLIEQLSNELDNWKEAAAQADLNADYYRNLLVQCGQAIGKEAYTCDDGTPQADVLVSKVPGLVRGLVMRADKWPDSKPMLVGGIRKRPDGKLEFEDVEQPDPDHTEGGKYRMLEAGEMLQLGDEFLFCNNTCWFPVMVFYPALSGQLYRRPVKPEPDYAQQAKNLLADINKAAPIVSCNTFVDLIIRAAKQ